MFACLLIGQENNVPPFVFKNKHWQGMMTPKCLLGIPSWTWTVGP